MSPREPQLLDTLAPSDGTERARLRFEPEGAEVRVPSGTPVFDAASWNGIAIGLPLEARDVGDAGLERALEALVG